VDPKHSKKIAYMIPSGYDKNSVLKTLHFWLEKQSCCCSKAA
jgi:hypothetical protein